MRIINIIDSLELNGGSVMFLEMTAAMVKYWVDDEIVPFVVSKTGQFGRPKLVDNYFPVSYGVDLQVCDYTTFQIIADKERNSVIFHHVLGRTKPIRFHKSCRYIVINHTMANIRRLRQFHPYKLVSVCSSFADQVKGKTRLGSEVILNGVEDYYDPDSRKKEGPFVIGRCQRIVPSKFTKVPFDAKSFPNGHRQVVIGPVNSGRGSLARSSLFLEHDVLMGTIFDRDRKIEMIRGFDVYLHNTPAPEGASMSVLEALSCGVPVLANEINGGIRELIKPGINGYFFKKRKDLKTLFQLLQDADKVKTLKKSLRKDFLKRLHIKNALEKYKHLACKP